MDKLRKIIDRLWYNKERIVLAAMVVLLCWNVYKVLNPPKEDPPPSHPFPMANVPPELDVGSIPLPPEPRQIGQWKSVTTPHPFWYLASANASKTTTEESSDEPDISLMRIQEVSGTYRAQLQTQSSRKWYREGESFESFVLLKIDPTEGSCQVRSEAKGKVFTLKLP